MIVPTLVATALLSPATWTVDDNGPADFSSIAAAIPQVLPDDTLLVEPGNYTGFSLGIPLTILGRPGSPKPVIIGPVEILPMAQATLAGLALNGLRMKNVAQRVAIDDCGVNGLADAPALDVNGCAQVLVTRTGISAGFMSGMLGARVQGSHVTFGTCSIQGGHGADFSFPTPADGAYGLQVVNSRVTLADTSVFGGAAGFNDTSEQGFSGGAIHAMSTSEVIVRGRPGNTLSAGSASPFGTPGATLLSQSGSVVVVSGVTVNGVTATAGGSIVEPTSSEPWLRVVGSDIPGQTRVIEVYGPVGSQALLFASFAPALLPSPLVELPFWFDPSALIAVRPLTTSGPSNPGTLPVSIPPSTLGLEGATIELQAVFPSLIGTLKPNAKQNTNAANLVVRF